MQRSGWNVGRNRQGIPNLRLIVIDPLLKLLRLKDSNSADDVTPAMEIVEEFAKTHKLHVMALAHEKKRKNEQDRHQNTAGSVAFRGASDTTFQSPARRTANHQH